MIPPAFNAYVGIPFRERGRDREGVDCWGLVRLIWEEVYGLALPDYLESYPHTTDGPAIGAALTRHAVDSPVWRDVTPGSERTGDGIMMRIGSHPLHVGLVVAPGLMIHCETGMNAVIEPYRGTRWGKRVLGFYRHEALT